MRAGGLHNVLNVLSTTEVYFKWLKGNIYVVCLLPQLSKKDNHQDYC